MDRPLLPLFLAVCGVFVATPSYGQTPLLNARFGGIGLIGPANSHPASVFYSPAALALRRGHHAFLEGSAILRSGTVALSPVDPLTGKPQGGSAADQSFLNGQPSFYTVVSSDLGTESIVLAIAAGTPANSAVSLRRGGDSQTFDPVAQGAARYHLVDFSAWHLYLTPSVSYQIVDEVVLGFGVSYVYGNINFGFVRDVALRGGSARDQASEYAALDDCGNKTPCNYGADAAAEAIRVRGSASGVAFHAGVLIRPTDRISIGVGYVSRVVAGFGDRAADGDAFVQRAKATIDNATVDVQEKLRGRATIGYRIPSVLSAGVNWQLKGRWALDLQGRWTQHSEFDRLEMRLSGSEFRDEPRVPDRIAHYRGTQDSFALQIGGSYLLHPRVELQAALMGETSAYEANAVSPATIDNFKLDGLIAARIAIGQYFNLYLGYNLVLMIPRTVSDSAYDPSTLVRCVDSFFDVLTEDCQLANAGRGLASSAGDYRLWQHRFSLGLAIGVW